MSGCLSLNVIVGTGFTQMYFITPSLQEPLVEVFTPSSKAVQNYVGNRLLVYVYREFRANEKPGQPPRIRNDELLSQFPSLSEGFTRKRLKTCADYQVCAF